MQPDSTISRNCTKCGLIKGLDDFRPRKHGKYGRSSVCRACYNETECKRQRAKRRLRRQTKQRSRVNALLSLPERELAYIAGIIDGEGTIGIFRAPEPKGRSGHRFHLRVSVANTSEPLMEFLASKTGVGSVRSKSSSSLARKPCFEWITTNRAAGDVLEAIVPYLVIKRDRALVGLELRETVSLESKLVAEPNCAVLSEDILERRRSLHAQMKALNGMEWR